MQLIHRIEQTRFSNSEAVIIDYILKNGLNIKNMSTSYIASQTYTSPSLLVRIAKKLGFHGWNDFKEAFLEELQYLYKETNIDASIPFVVSDDIMTIAHNIGQLEIETIQDTMSLINHDDLQLALRYLRDCKELDIYGVSNNLLLAEEFKAKMFFLHKNVNICQLPGNASTQAAMSNEKHCAILISYSGETDYIIKIAKILKQRQTPMIAITSIADNKLSQVANVSLRISSREMILTKIGDFATTTSIKYLLDTLYSGIFAFDYQKNLDYKIQIAKMVDDRHSGYEYIDEDDK